MLDGQHSQHREILLEAGTNSDPDRNQGLQKMCWYKTEPDRDEMETGKTDKAIIHKHGFPIMKGLEWNEMEDPDWDTLDEDPDWDTLDRNEMEARTTEAGRTIKIIYKNGLPIVEGLEWDSSDPDCDTLDEDPDWDTLYEDPDWDTLDRDEMKTRTTEAGRTINIIF